jgi:hypothetical protein
VEGPPDLRHCVAVIAVFCLISILFEPVLFPKAPRDSELRDTSAIQIHEPAVFEADNPWFLTYTR